MNNKLIPIVITLVVGIILAGSVLMPVLNDATATERSFVNEGYFTMDKVASDADFTLTIEYGNPVITINDKEIDLSTAGFAAGKSYTLMGGDNFVLRVYWATSPYPQYFGDQSVTPAFISAVTAGSKLTATVSNGEIVFASTDPSYTDAATLTLSENTYCINADGKGAYTMKKADGTAYIEKNTDIIILDGITAMASSDVGIYAEGTINDNLTATTFRGTSVYDVTIGDFTYTTEAVSGVIDMVKLEKVEFTATQNSTDYDVTYSYFIVPTEVTAELSEHLTPGQIALLGAIPVLVIVALLVVAVGVVARRND